MTDASTSRRAQTGPALTFLTGLDLTRFQAEVWSRRPLLIAAAERAVSTPIFSLDDADDLLSTRGLRTPFLRIAKDGQLLPTRRFVGSGGAGARVADQVVDERVLEEFTAGSTLVFQGLHRVWPPLQDLAGRLADELGHPVQVNAYLTPSSSRGFSAHYDTHDVFVVQVAGHKSWRCFAPLIDAPLPAQEWTTVREQVTERATGTAELTATLGPGDCLYLPRGWVHEAAALGGISLHLTFGVHPLSRADLVRHAVDAVLQRNPELRRSLPAGIEVADPAQLRPDFDTALVELTKSLDELDPADLVHSLEVQRWADVRPAPLRPVRQAGLAATLTPDAVLIVRPGSHPRLHVDGDVPIVRVGDAVVPLPHTDVAILTRLLRGGSASVREFASDPDEALEAARTLLVVGILVEST
ncbi:MAG: cupin domain-containing protein [Candidatus Nanopelagicales bacterium]